jgi:hypothetical protein
MLIWRRSPTAFEILLAACVLCLNGCGSGRQSTSSGNFAARANSTTPAGTASVARVSVSHASLTGGNLGQVTVQLAQPAPEGGLAVQLKTSDARVATIPAVLTIPAGAISASSVISTAPVTTATVIGVTALYGNTLAGTSLVLTPAITSPFSLTLKPNTLSIAPGNSGSSTITTKVAAGYSHALTLSVSHVPSGVAVNLSPTSIPAPGSGTAQATISVGSGAVAGSYSIYAKASDGTYTRTSRLTLKIAAEDAVATFQGCWYHSSGNAYQGVLISVQTPGTYPFNAVLYNGTACNSDDFADQFGFGQALNFGGFDYIFWFTDFANQTDMSALWYVGNSTSECVNYKVAPSCP